LNSTVPPSRVSAFLDSIGVNVHMGYLNTPYGRSSSVVLKLDYLGLHHVRDTAAWSGWVAPLKKLGEAGIKLDLMVGVQGDLLDAQFAYLEELAPYIATVEGPNEVNFWKVTFNGQTGINAAVQQQAYINQRLEASAGLKDKPLVGFSVSASSSAGFAPYGDNSGPNDYGNAHVYFPAGTRPAAHLAKYVGMASALTPGDRMFLTETGLPTNAGGAGNQGVSETVQAKYTLDLLMDAYQQGILRTFLYELQDQFPDPQNTNQEMHYGLFRNDGSAKPAAIAIHNLTTILADDGAQAGSFATGSIAYSVKGMPSTGSSLLMQESNGNFDLVLWNEPAIWDDASSLDLAAPSTPVTISLGGTYQTINLYDPLVSSSVLKTFHNVSDVTVDVTDHPVILEIIPAKAEGEPAASSAFSLAPAPTIGAFDLPSIYVTANEISRQVKVSLYEGPVSYLIYKFLGSQEGEAVVSTLASDFLNLQGGDDAADAGAGNDVLDGGTGANFLTGGAGWDVYFLDGRGSETTWSTITDWTAGEQLSVWGWRPGVSRASWVDRAGAEGYQGITLHADLDGNGQIDTSVTWSSLTRTGLPSPTQHDGLLWFA
jgi:hypothetical protein